MKVVAISSCIILMSFLCAPCSAQTSAVSLPNGETTGCGGYTTPIFPASAGEDYKNTCWVARVKKDQFTDKVTCLVYPAGMNIKAYPFIVFSKSQVAMTVSGGDRYPGTPMMIRVDQNAAIAGGKDFSRSSVSTLLKEMSSGSIIMARYSDWPYNTYVVGKMGAKGIAEAIAYCRAHVQ